MEFGQTAPKHPIQVSLDDNLVRQVQLLTRDLSSTVEDLLRDFVARERAQRRAEDSVDLVIDGLNTFHREHGLLSDEFSSF
jgi:antitoxin CcdA